MLCNRKHHTSALVRWRGIGEVQIIGLHLLRCSLSQVLNEGLSSVKTGRNPYVIVREPADAEKPEPVKLLRKSYAFRQVAFATLI